MSDIFREQLEALAQQVSNEGLPPGKCSGDVLYDVLHQYDTTAPDRERERKALQVFEEALKWDDSTTCYECPFRPICWMGGRRIDLCTRLVGFGRERGILPVEEAHREAE